MCSKQTSLHHLSAVDFFFSSSAFNKMCENPPFFKQEKTSIIFYANFSPFEESRFENCFGNVVNCLPKTTKLILNEHLIRLH